MRAYEKYIENRITKMRLGQATGEVVTLSGVDDEDQTRFVVVPLTDAQNLMAFSMADAMELSDTTFGIVGKEEMVKRAIIFYAARELQDFTKPFFLTPEETAEIYDHDINHAYDIYLEMVSQASPAFALLDDEELDNLKKVWSRINLRELSGPQQYAASRFLVSIRPLLQQASFSGLSSTKNLTEKTETETLVENADKGIQTP